MNEEAATISGAAPKYSGTGGLHVRIARYLVFSFLLIVVPGGCAYKRYDPQKPDGYWHFWQDQNNVKNSVLYPLATDRDDAVRSRR